MCNSNTNQKKATLIVLLTNRQTNYQTHITPSQTNRKPKTHTVNQFTPHKQIKQIQHKPGHNK